VQQQPAKVFASQGKKWRKEAAHPSAEITSQYEGVYF
jgi:hypothetical protein